MNKRGRIPIAEGKRLCEKYKSPMVVVFSLHDAGGSFNVMTYGQNKALCRYAASLGEQIAQRILDGTIAPAQEEPKHLPDHPALWEGNKKLMTQP